MLNHIRMGKLAGWRPRGRHEHVRESCMMNFVRYSISVGTEISLTVFRPVQKERKPFWQPHVSQSIAMHAHGNTGTLQLYSDGRKLDKNHDGIVLFSFSFRYLLARTNARILAYFVSTKLVLP